MQKTIYYTDETQDFAGTNIHQKPLPIDHKYFHGPIWNGLAFLFYYGIASPFAWLVQKIWYREKVIGKKKIKPHKKEGFFLYGNHTRLLGDAFGPPTVCYPKKVHVIANPDAVSIPVLGNLPEMLGCVPLPTERKGMENFHHAVKKHAEKGHVVGIFPEAKIWPYYTKIRPFRAGSFRYPVETGKPAFCMTVTYQKSKWCKRPKSVTYIDGPFFGEGETEKERQRDLQAKIDACMRERVKESNCEYIKYIKKDQS